MAEPQPPAVAPAPSTDVVFLDFADWRAKAVQDRELVRGLGVSWSMPGQEVRAALDVPPEQADFVRDFVITTEEQDRYGDVIDLKGWDWGNYFKGGDGVVLLNHDRRGLSLGSCPWIKQMGPALVGRCRFPTQAECGYEDGQPSLWKTVRLLYVNGFMKSTSVGLMPIEWTWDEETGGLHFIKQEGLEWSLVAVPANPSCNALAKQAGIDLDPLRDYAMRTLDLVSGVEGVYVTKARLEKALKALGSEKGLRYFDAGEAWTACAARESGAAPATSAPPTPRGKGLKKLLRDAGIGVEDLISVVKRAKADPVAAEKSDAPVDDSLYLEVADPEPNDGELVLVDDAGKSVELSRDGLVSLLRGVFDDAYNAENTRVTGKVY